MKKRVYIRRPIFLFFFFFACGPEAFPGQYSENGGARQSAMAGVSVTQTDAFSSYYNQAGLGYAKKSMIGASVTMPYLLKEIGVYALTAAFPIRNANCLALSVQHFGNSLFHQTQIGLSYGRAFHKTFAAGLKLNHAHTYIAEHGTLHTATFDIGVLFRPLETIRIGFHVSNPVAITYAASYQELFFTTVRIGGSYHPTNHVQIAVEVEKIPGKETQLKMGVEYLPTEKVALRIGARTGSILFAAGIGLLFEHVHLDISSSWHIQLGYTPQLSIIYSLKNDVRKK